VRRTFDLPQRDVEHLDATGLPWETVIDGDSRWLLIHDRPTHTGYRDAAALTALQIVPQYPDSALDMVWFFPALVPKDGRAIKALSIQSVDGRAFQRWSRHRSAENPWRPDVDDIASHLLLVDEWLAREFHRQ
jgi:hypothetical protein